MMLNPKLNNCIDCTTIEVLLNNIDRKIFKISNDMYNNLVFMLNKDISKDIIVDLLHYKRILTYRYYNSEYANAYTLEMITSKVKRLISGGIETCQCEESLIILPTTTTTTSTSLTTTTTTTTTIPLQEGLMSLNSNIDQNLACSEINDTSFWMSTNTPLIILDGDVVYTNSLGTINFIGNNNFYKLVLNGGNFYSARIDVNGILSDVQLCAS